MPYTLNAGGSAHARMCFKQLLAASDSKLAQIRFKYRKLLIHLSDELRSLIWVDIGIRNGPRKFLGGFAAEPLGVARRSRECSGEAVFRE
jgi:hypothetical protein